ncbi:MAG: hypothetical protein RIS51_604 [Actinomycetota bacterium]|jgi:hypothetical protein
MNFPTGLGGITLIVIAVVWLLVFVPGWSKRSEVKAATETVNREVKIQRRTFATSNESRVARLIMTQRLFTFLFIGWLIAAGLLIANTGSGLVFTGLGAVSALLSGVSLMVRMAATRELRTLVSMLNSKRQISRERAFKSMSLNTEPVRDWTPNPLPAPMQIDRTGELLAPDADVIEIKNAQKKNFDTQDLNAILQRRRAI